MKKLLAAVLSAAITSAALAGCGGASSQTENKAAQQSKKTINDILAESQAQSTTTAAKLNYPELDYTAEVDLTTLNSNMVYSTVYNMVNSSGEYKGKTVKAEGTFDVFTDPKTGNMYFACIIADATACCSQGLEFKWNGDHTYPDDYPNVGDPITIGGVFDTYKEGNQTYCRLNDAEVAFAKS